MVTFPNTNWMMTTTTKMETFQSTTWTPVVVMMMTTTSQLRKGAAGRVHPVPVHPRAPPAPVHGRGPGPALEAHPVPDLDLAPGPTPDPVPGLERALLPGRGPAHPPPRLRGDRSAVAPGPHLERESGGVLDHIRPKDAAASPLDPPILAPVQKRNNLITAFTTRKEA